MTQISNPKSGKYDLEERTQKFALNVFDYVERLSKTSVNSEVIKQLIRSAGSVGANYIEANEALGKKDFFMKIKTCKREAKEACYWLNLSRPGQEAIGDRESLVREATELMKIFGAIATKAL